MIIYRIHNNVTNQSYIGQTTRPNPQSRWWIHRSLLRNGKHRNVHLQRSWDKHGEGAFTFDILTTCEDQYSLDLLERFAIHQQGHYNLDDGGRGMGARSEEVKRKISAAHKGKHFTEEHRTNLRIAAQRRQERNGYNPNDKQLAALVEGRKLRHAKTTH